MLADGDASEAMCQSLDLLLKKAQAENSDLRMKLGSAHTPAQVYSPSLRRARCVLSKYWGSLDKIPAHDFPKEPEQINA